MYHNKEFDLNILMKSAIIFMPQLLSSLSYEGDNSPLLTKNEISLNVNSLVLLIEVNVVNVYVIHNCSLVLLPEGAPGT